MVRELLIAFDGKLTRVAQTCRKHTKESSEKVGLRKKRPITKSFMRSCAAISNRWSRERTDKRIRAEFDPRSVGGLTLCSEGRTLD